MRNRERGLLEDLIASLSSAMDTVAFIIETRESVNDEDPIVYDLHALYLGIHMLIDDVEDIGYDL